MEKQKNYEAYLKSTHRLGRIVSVITLILLVGAPFLIGTLLGAGPDLGAVARGFLSVGLVWTVSSVVEFLVYTPMLGAGGSYLAFITGNLTIVVLALGVVLLIPLQPVLQSPVLAPAFANVVPALFGAMAYKYYRKDPLLALIPLTVMIILFTLVPSLTSSTSFMIIPAGALAIGLAWMKYRREMKGAADK